MIVAIGMIVMTDTTDTVVAMIEVDIHVAQEMVAMADIDQKIQWWTLEIMRDKCIVII